MTTRPVFRNAVAQSLCLLAMACAAVPAFADAYTSASYVQEGLIAQWDAIDNAGQGLHVPDATVWKDLTGGGRDLELTVNGSWGASGNAFNVNGLSAKGAVAAPNYRTIEVVFRLTDSTKAEPFLFLGSSSPTRVLIFNEYGTKGCFDSSNRESPYVEWTFDASAIRHMAGTYNDDKNETIGAVYGNGVAVDDGTYKRTWNPTEDVIMIGNRVMGSQASHNFVGELYAIRLYSGVLTPEQIAANYAVDMARFTDAPRRVFSAFEISGDSATATFAAGQAGDSHELYLVWDALGVDHGADIDSWPYSAKIADVADDATSSVFALPTGTASAGRLCCRAILKKQDGTAVAVSTMYMSDPRDPSLDYVVLYGPTIFTAEEGTTNVFSGLISGTGPAIIQGGGTVAFSHANNTYTGGTLVSNAVFRLDANGCAGSGKITCALQTSHIFVNCSNVPNELLFRESYGNNEFMAPGAYPQSAQCPLLPLCSDVTMEGLITFNKWAYLTDSTDPAMFSPPPTVTFKKDVYHNGSYLQLVTMGRMVFEGVYTGQGPTSSSSVNFGFRSSATGTVEFHSSSNFALRAALRRADVDLRAADAFPDTLFYYDQDSGEYSSTFLNGYDQTILGYAWGSGGSNPGETAAGHCVTSDAPATLTIKGCQMSRVGSLSLVNKFALHGEITLVMDVDSAYTEEGFFQDFSVRRSTMTGGIVISNGDFRVSGTASFPNVPSIFVGEGGSFSNRSTRASTFASCRSLTVLGKMACVGDAKPFPRGDMSLTLGEDAEFSLPEGTTLKVGSLKVNGADMPEGRYGDTGTPLDQIKSGSVLVHGQHWYVDCVNGSDSNSGDRDHPVQTIRSATASAASGDIIHVAPGTYGDLEGFHRWVPQDRSTYTSGVGVRVVIPEGVTLESTDGPEKTFIVGAPSPNPTITSGWQAGVGPDAVRCVAAMDGAVLRGFTLTGGFTDAESAVTPSDRYGSAFYADSARMAAIEDCIVSNNVAGRYTINRSVVRRCRVIGNCASPETTYNYLSGSAGVECSWYSCIIDGNKGNATILNPVVVDGCTVGRKNVMPGSDPTKDPISSQALYYGSSTPPPLVNTLWCHGAGIQLSSGVKLCCTNCVVPSNRSSQIKDDSLNVKYTSSTDDIDSQIDSEYRPIPGAFIGLDMCTPDYPSEACGDRDVYGNPRVMNGAMDIGAVEYDWRPVFQNELGRRFVMAFASPSVTTNAAGGLRIPDGEISGKMVSDGTYDVAFNVTGGSLAVYVAGTLVGESSGDGDQAIRFIISDPADEVRIVFTPDSENPGVAVLKPFAKSSGFVLRVR